MNIARVNPKLMVVGDSLPQGCRSLTVRASLCAQSWPARLAAAQGWDFVPPDHPWEVLFDLEQEIRRLNPILVAPSALSLVGLPDRILDNLNLWVAATPNSLHQSFDNLAIAGSEVHHMYSGSWNTFFRQVQAHLRTDLAAQLDHFSDLHIAINGQYVLNPQKVADFDDFSPLDWVERRQPEMLVVHSGHNHGLFKFGFLGKNQSITQGEHNGRNYFQQWQEVAERIARLPASVERVVIVLLPKVSAVAALQPVSDLREDGYSEAYRVRLLPTSLKIDRSVVVQADAQVREVNSRIRDLFIEAANATQTAHRLVFVDTYQAFDEIDYKNRLNETARVRVNASQFIDNRYLDGELDFAAPQGKRLKAGGYLSIDGMHPSGAGYADLACRVMTELNLPHDRDAIMQHAFDQDRLLSNYPLELDALLNYVDVLRPFNDANWFSTDSPDRLRDHTHFSQAIKQLAKLFTK
ncbi:hypothetical protein JYG34_12440 [Pseudomonas entomophila]|uniref:SGNH/GDSL hydrolase family protein n=1 Tax=Pseudomonas entomophila TaxID=312306 RepID=UPI001BCA6F33|nr:SGNH/GDSL hydrolase family protein [Pseudomonas entomophila]QVM93771.1 hypothetical protein JYG34_12440 [Pseudomonas entomophila]